MVPVLFTSFDRAFVDLLSQGPTFAAGPNIGVRPMHPFGISAGGVRIYDTVTGLWTDAGGGFGAQRWMEHSAVRNVLFVCNAKKQIMAFDTSRPDHHLALLGLAPSAIECDASSTFRDIHIVDFRQGDKFYTVFIDTADQRNHLIFFETTDLNAWRRLSEVHANWEFSSQGLGQVKVTEDGEKLLITWHCSTIYCGPSSRPDGSLPGERLYVLSLTQGLEKGYAPPVLGAVELPMSPGSIVRDVACNKQNLCLVSMSWDGVAVVDLGEGPNKLKIIAQHSASFTGWQTNAQSENTKLPSDMAYIRMVAGAQKVVPSRKREGRFYMERWSFDAMAWYYEGKPLSESLRYDSIWAIDVLGYVRPGGDSQMPPIFDPAVSGVLLMPSVDWSATLASVTGQQDGFEKLVARGLQAALGIDSSRLLVVSSSPAVKGATVEFTILDGAGASPETLFNALWRQLDTKFSGIHTGPLSKYVEGASLQRLGAPPPAARGRGSQRPDMQESLRGRQHEDAESSLLGPVMFVLFLVLAVASLYYFIRMRRALQKVQGENTRLRQDMQLVASAGSPGSQVGLATGYVVGRPGSPNGDPSSEKTPLPSAMDSGAVFTVVGNPINSGGAAATGVAAGMAMAGRSKLDQPERPTPSWPAQASVPQSQAPELPNPSSQDSEDQPARPSVVIAATGNRDDPDPAGHIA
eukprot:gb/GFBE01079868.1/.p1 GENE.gb/GFBE01079868.1/~~gb/GFBE01079868.1/.p1  ORF type:complete len:691 (+),score=91.63 gb/GFBE01079868.1/:1-2073(+)